MSLKFSVLCHSIMLKLTTMCPPYIYVMLMSSATIRSWGPIKYCHVSSLIREKRAPWSFILQMISFINLYSPKPSTIFKKSIYKNLWNFEILKFQNFKALKFLPSLVLRFQSLQSEIQHASFIQCYLGFLLIINFKLQCYNLLTPNVFELLTSSNSICETVTLWNSHT